MAADSDLRDLADRLLVKDRAVHRETLSRIAEEGDDRLVPHLVELATIDAVANDWETFGFPEVLREEQPPRSLTHPEVAWPGVIDALCAIAEPTFDGPAAWLKWEAWLTEQDIEPLPGFAEWKIRLFKRYHPLVGNLLDTSPRHPDMEGVRWGNTDPASLHPLNGPEFLPAGEAEYLRDSDLVFGFEVAGQPYAVPRYLVFPHEMLNVELGGIPLSLTYCTMCNSPILYDCRVDELTNAASEDGRTLSFGSTGCIHGGNKLMYDEETGSLWAQHRGVPVAGPYAKTDTTLDFLPVTQCSWREWREKTSETMVLNPDTGYEWEYEYYRDYDGFISRHYWENDSVTHPGVKASESDDSDENGEKDEHALGDKEYVYGVEHDETVHVYPVDWVAERGVVADELDGQSVVILGNGTDVAVYEAPPFPLSRSGDSLEDGSGTTWKITRDALVGETEAPEVAGSEATTVEDDSPRLERVPGRHGLWLAFRTSYDDWRIVPRDDRFRDQ
ncbi:DUF3179 domain-containing (seleno)protein [Haladaptatus sp. NG-SE-30]